MQFRGNEGKREAILGLLRLALTLPSGQELWCLMQDTQRWFTEDDTYINTWESVNLAFLAAGNSIRVIHTIDRHYDMLAKSLLSWLPLYLTGKVMPYFLSSHTSAGSISKIIFRLNTWFRFTDTFYGLGTTVEPLKKLIDSGLLGWPLKGVHLWSN